MTTSTINESTAGTNWADLLNNAAAFALDNEGNREALEWYRATYAKHEADAVAKRLEALYVATQGAQVLAMAPQIGDTQAATTEVDPSSFSAWFSSAYLAFIRAYNRVAHFFGWKRW